MQKLSEKAKENKNKYIHQYQKKHYKRIPLDVSTDKYQQIKASAEKSGESISGYVKKAIDDRLSKDNLL